MKINDKLFNYMAGALIVLAAVLVYSNTFKVPLQFDDIYHIQQKQTIQDISNFSKIKAWENVGGRPLAMFTLALNYRWSGENVTGYHVFNLIFHIITGWLVYLLTLQLLSLKGIKSRDWLQENKHFFSLLVALIFIAHPMQTQAVTYIIQRITALATLFYLLTILMYIKGRISHIDEGFGSNAIKYYLLTIVSFVLAILSKQTAATIPLAIVLTEAFFIRGADGKLQKKFFFILSGAVAMIIVIGLIVVGLPRETKEYTRSEYFITSLRVMAKYIQMMILPVGQNLDHDITASESLFRLKEMASLIFLLGIAYLGIYMFKKDRLISFGIFWFFVTLSVESSVIPIRDFMFEHRMYLPSYGFILAAVAGLSYIPGKVVLGKYKLPATLFLMLALVVAAGFTAYARNKVWQSDLSLWSDAVEKSPNKARPYMWQGIAYSNLKDYQKAKAAFDKCIEIMPTFSMAYFNRANVYKELEENRKAVQDYTKAIEYKKDYELAYFNRGVVRAKMGNRKGAIKDYTNTIRINPKNALAYYNRGNAYRTQREFQKALDDYDKAIRIDPKYSLAFFNRGLTKAAMDKHTDALADFDLAITIDPRNHLFYNGKGVSLHALKMYKEAVQSYGNTIALNPKFGQAYYNRAYSKFFGLNDRDGACEDWKIALQYKYMQAEKMLAEYCQPGQSNPK